MLCKDRSSELPTCRKSEGYRFDLSSDILPTTVVYVSKLRNPDVVIIYNLNITVYTVDGCRLLVFLCLEFWPSAETAVITSERFMQLRIYIDQ